MKNKLKDSKGVVSVFAMLSMLFFLLFIIGAYIGVSRLNKMQKSADKELLKLYSSNIDPQDIYNDMISDVDEVIPVYEYADLPTRNSRFKAINGKIYYLTPKSSYELRSDIVIPAGSPLYENVYQAEYQYSNTTSMKLMLDGDNNSGIGHDSSLQTSHGYTRYAVWKNLLNLDDECSIYSGGTNRAFTTGTNWEDQSLIFDGSGMYVLANDELNIDDSEETIEIVFKTTTNTKKQYLFSNSNTSVGIIPKSGYGVFFLEYEKNGVVVTKETTITVESNKIYHVALTYNGIEAKLYVNGVSALESSNFQTTPISFSTVPYRYKSNRFAIGQHTYIGTIADTNATSGISILPYFVSGSSYPITPEFRITAAGKHESKITNTTNGQSANAKDFFVGFSGLLRANNYTFSYALKYMYNGSLKTPEMIFSGINIGSNVNDEDSIAIVAKGSDSVIIRSNVGKITNWYISRGTSGTYGEINPTREVQALGKWYYSFDNLDSNTSSGVTYSIKGDYDATTEGSLNSDAGNIYIGRRYNTFENDSLVGQVYAVRVYNSALASDNIQTNFSIDKTKYGIN